MDTDAVARWLIIGGVLIALVGGLVLLLSRVPFFGRLLGDISWHRDGFWLFIPLAPR